MTLAKSRTLFWGQTMELDISQLNSYIDDIAKRQMPFATASALTQTAATIGKHMANLTASSMKTLTPFSRTHRTARIGGAPSPASSYATIPANKRDGMGRMFAEVGNQHCGASRNRSPRRRPIERLATANTSGSRSVVASVHSHREKR